MCRKTRARGFTLLEVMVVLALAALTLVFTVPRLGLAPVTDPGLRAARWILTTVESLKRSAVVEQRVYTLHVDVPSNRLWVTREAEAGDRPAPAVGGGLELAGRARLLGAACPGSGQAAETGAAIRFFPQGHSDPATIDLTVDGDRRLSFRVEPFLARARLLDTGAGAGP